MKQDKPVLELVGCDGNAFGIIGAATRVARKAGWSKDQIDTFTKDAMSGDYDHLLQVCMKHFDVC